MSFDCHLSFKHSYINCYTSFVKICTHFLSFRAGILDGDSKQVFEWVAAAEMKLNVTFAPQSRPNQVQ